ncbi:Alpha-tubulin N-acetyltransferase 1 [Lunasporangiospora selenospora]|uniref:Alpha-tubulin N-acetyltransferase 1 n=1 Tax=Lunasporangiospora selenospora TaxID=979761 RepID=A0A9P6KCC1_9FUNG|nr:Alpha-tubulin N-acetyltransferase 1 [Lunasporangiospora selenospora]
MDFDFPLIPLLPQPITLVPASAFLSLENQRQAQLVFASSVSIGISKSASSGTLGASSNGPPSLLSTSVSSVSSGSFPTASSSSLTSSTSGSITLRSNQERLGAIVDALGEASAKAQELPTSITQRARLAQNPNQRVYILRTGLQNEEDHWLEQINMDSPLMHQAIQKSITVLNKALSATVPSTSSSATSSDNDDASSISSMEDMPTNRQALDGRALKKSALSRSEEKGVYVVGMLKMGEKRLFIVVEGIDPRQLAYDRPSPKLYQFLKKHFGLARYLPQPNQYAIFEGFMLQDCGKSIQVDDEKQLVAGRRTGTNLAGGITLGAGTPALSSSPSSASTPLPIPSPLPLETTQQSSSIPGGSPSNYTHADSGSVADYIGARPEQQQPQQTNRRVSSIFSSSINLSSPCATSGDRSITSSATGINNGDVGGNGGGSDGVGGGGGMATNVFAPAISSPANGSMTKKERISRMFASSIVFSDPAAASNS